MSHSLCQWLPQIFADNRQLLHSRNLWVCCIPGSAGGMIWWGEILPNLTPPGPSNLSSALVLLPRPAPHLAPVPLSGGVVLSLCTAVGLPPSLGQVLALVNISLPACSPKYQQRSTSESISGLWSPVPQRPCQYRKTISKSCCSAPAAGGCSVPAALPSVI